MPYLPLAARVHRRLSPFALAMLLVAVAACTRAEQGGAQVPDTTRGVRIGLTYAPGTVPRVVVAVAPGPASDSLRAILERDFRYGGRVGIVPLDTSEVATLLGRGRAPNYALLGRMGAAAVVQVTPTPAGLHVALHDVTQRRVAAVEDVAVEGPYPGRAWRWGVHGVADLVTQWITGERGIAQTRIAFERGRRLWLIDSDGAGEVVVPTHGETVMSPAWHPNGTALLYNTYGTGSRVVLHDLLTGRTRTASTTSGGVNLTPVFSRDARWMAYAHGTQDGTDIYVAPAEGGAPARRITVARGTLNMSPSFSPDGRRVAFTTDRSGPPAVYIMDADGTNAELLTRFVFGEESYQSNPDWSPDGRQVAFQARIAGRFQLKTISLRDGSGRQLTDVGTNEDPSWAPNGRHVVFTSTRGGTRQLWILDTETNEARQLTHGPGGARLAAWSPRLTR